METDTLSSADVPLGSIGLFAPGTSIGERFEVVDVLGSGGYAVVYRVYDTELKRQIALKVLRPERMSPESVERFRREVAVARDAASRHLIRIYDIGTSPQAIYLSMELIEGSSLRERMQQGCLPLEDTLRIAIDVLEGLSVLHSLGVVHRDVKPPNVLMTANGEVKLADFGLARYVVDEQSLTQSVIVGTADYLSPEQALGQPLDQRSDLYSFGVMLFEMLAGRLPFEASSSIGVVLERLRKTPPDVRKLAAGTPRWLARVVARLLSRNPATRYANAAEVLHDLRRRRSAVVLPGKVAVAIAAIAIAGWGAYVGTRPHAAAPVFSALRASGDTAVEAIDDHGRVLWRLPNVDGEVAHRWTLATIERGGRPVIATVLHPWRNFRPSDTRMLRFLDPNTGVTIRSVRLPTAASAFPDQENTFSASAIRAIDLDGDGIDELVLSYFQVPMGRTFTVLYEPKIDRARIVLEARGGHDIVGAIDVDGDGHRDLLFVGINNGVGWRGAVAAIRVSPWIGSDGPGDTTWTPENQQYVDSTVIWYCMIPHGRIDTGEGLVGSDPIAKTITIRAAAGRPPVVVTYDGFLADTKSEVGIGERNALRMLAYENLRNAERTVISGNPGAATHDFEQAMEQAGRSGDAILKEAISVRAARALVGSGRAAAAEKAFDTIAANGDDPPQATLEAGEAFHLAGDLDRAARWYGRATEKTTLYDGTPALYAAEDLTLLEAERGNWSGAIASIDRYEAIFGSSSVGLLEVLRQYFRFRSGASFRRIVPMGGVLPPLYAYFDLEVRNALRKPASRTAANELLRDVNAQIESGNRERGGLLSLRAVLLGDLGDGTAALASAREAISVATRERSTRIYPRFEAKIAEERLRLLEQSVR